VRADADLLAAWQSGDADAGEELVSRHFAGVSRFFRGKVGAADAADLIAETFLACVEGKKRIESGNFRGYLYAVARRRLADHFRHRGRRDIDLSVSSLVDLGTSPSGKVARREASELLRAGLARIPIDDQIALELAYWEGLSGREIAAALGVAENTARSRLSRARDRLRAALGEIATPLEASLAEARLEEPE
jgi:RNA polymerase sigma-70 factor (ECF subfamily)